MEIFLLYLFTRLNALHATLFVLSLLAGLGYIIWFLVIESIYDYDKIVEAKKRQTKVLIICAISTVFLIIIPEQKSAAIVMGGWAVLEVAKTETAQRLASKSVQTIEKALDKYLEADATSSSKASNKK